MNKLLSILICSMTSRDKSIGELLEVLEPQMTNEVEILINSDNGQVWKGLKRNQLIDSAQGEYIAFIDDDDLVSDDYISLILDAVKTRPDVVGMHLLMTRGGWRDLSTECRTFHSIKYDHWDHKDDPERPGKLMYFRCPNHLNPVKREYASATKFPTSGFAEDKAYSLALFKNHLQGGTEVYIESPIYYYIAGTARKIIK